MTDNEFEYDVALSFAGEDRAIAREFADLLTDKKIKVFYDEDYADDLWGKDLIAHLADLYQNEARFCVMFISIHYPLKHWTNFERQHIQARAFRDANEYILPIRIDDTDVPGIAETTGYRDIRQHSLQSIANVLEKKLAKVKGQPTTTSQVVRPDSQDSSHSLLGAIPMPKVRKSFTQLDKDRFSKEAFNYIKQYFQSGLRELEVRDRSIQTDFTDVNNLEFMCKIYIQGNIKAECRIWLGESTAIYYSEETRRLGQGNSYNDYLPVEENADELYLHIGIFGLGMIHVEEPSATQQQAAEYLWRRLTSKLEYR